MAISYLTIRVQFLEYLFGAKEGWLNIAYAMPNNARFRQRFFQWPAQKAELGHFIETVLAGHNIWYAVSLFEHAERKKEYALPNNIVWADLDFVHPESLDIRPSVALKTSNEKYQALWRLEQDVSWEVAQEYSKRLAYKVGADKSGWDATQLLRVPYTHNYKYELDDLPIVDIMWVEDTTFPTSTFDLIPVGDADFSDAEIPVDRPMPATESLPSLDTILYHHRFTLSKVPQFATLFYEEPAESDDWSKRLWHLVNLAFECDMTLDEVFVIAMHAKCNKYERDNRPLSYLWREVLKAEILQKKRLTILGTVPLSMPTLVEQTEADHEFMFAYKDWAAKITDAPAEYHELGFFVMLSAVLSDLVSLKTSFAPLGMGVNIWGLVLGNSTLTRKTTAMNLIKDILLELDYESIIASDASPEGLLGSVADRSRRVSIFFKDEISGFFKNINVHRYMSSMPEVLTNLYDVPEVYTRQLAKTTVKITKPYFIIFGGGIRDAVYEQLSHEYVFSGFIPRFLVVSASHDTERLRPVGPPQEYAIEGRNAIIKRLADLRDLHYKTAYIRDMQGNSLAALQPQMDAKLSDKAWERFNDIMDKLILAADNSYNAEIAQPTFQRLGYSTLKMATLLAASRSQPTSANTIVVNENDVVDAATYTQRWGHHTVDLITNTGKTMTEKKLDQVLSTVIKHPGVLRSELMQRHSLGKKDATEVFGTLEERGLLEAKRQGKGTRFYPLILKESE
jgi:ribosomal protein S25